MKEDLDETTRSRWEGKDRTSSELTGSDVRPIVGIGVALLVLSAGVAIYVVFVRLLLLLAKAITLLLWLHFSPL